MKSLQEDGARSVRLAIQVALLLGTIGWLVVGFDLIEDCGAKYGCTQSGCQPCATTEHWINAGAIAQWVLACLGVAAVTLMWKRVRKGKELPGLAAYGDCLLAMSVLTLVGTTWVASHAY